MVRELCQRCAQENSASLVEPFVDEFGQMYLITDFHYVSSDGQRNLLLQDEEVELEDGNRRPKTILEFCKN